MAETYKWKSRVCVSGVKAQAAGEQLEKIRTANHGFLLPRHVVSDAKEKESPLHNCFEWDNSTAAAAYREDQARYILRSVVVVMNEGDPNEKIVRAFVSIKHDDDVVEYTSLAHAMSSKELREQVVARAWAELKSWRIRYKEYDELAKVFAVVDRQRVA